MAISISDFTKKYFASFDDAVKQITVTDNAQNKIEFADAVDTLVSMLKKIQSLNKKLMMVGNGGSASICSHMTVDYWKNGNIRSTAFNDSSLLTTVSNDYSYAEVFSKTIEMFADEGDMLYCISSSGKSVNILNGADAALKKNCNVITFSGFSEDNPLRKKGMFNFYIPAVSYGYCEILHLFIIHAILDAKMFCYDGVDIFNANKKL
jgi:D-sedoheptulose 7-phosphate isomerase